MDDYKEPKAYKKQKEQKKETTVMLCCMYLLENSEIISYPYTKLCLVESNIFFS